MSEPKKKAVVSVVRPTASLSRANKTLVAMEKIRGRGAQQASRVAAALLDAQSSREDLRRGQYGGSWWVGAAKTSS